MAFNNKKKNANYISAKESRAIARENRKITQEIEKKRNRKHIPEEEYVTKMKNPENCVEFDNVQTYFFTDREIAAYNAFRSWMRLLTLEKTSSSV